MDTEMTSYANLLGLANTKEKQMARFVLVHGGFSSAWIWLPLIDSLRAAGHSVEALDLPTANIDVSTTLDRTTIDMHSYPHGPSESEIERRSKTEAPRAFAPARRSSKRPAHRQLF